MALIPILIDRTSKPPIGTPLRSDGHWSVQGLVRAWAFNEGAGKSIFDAVSGRAGQTRGGKPWGDPDGLFGDGIAQEGVYLPDNIPDHPVSTLVSTGGWSVFSAAMAIASISSVELSIQATGVARVRRSTSLVYPTATSTALPPLVTSISATVVGVTAPAIYVNGFLATSTSVAGSGTVAARIKSSIGCFAGNDYGGPLNGVICSLLQYTCILTDKQIASISANPWQIYEPETVWVEVGGGGEIFSGTFSTSIESLIQYGVGQIGCGGGMSANAGSAAYSMGGLEGKQGVLSIGVSDLLQILSGNSGNSGNFNSQLLSLTQWLNGQHGVSGSALMYVSTGAEMVGKLGVSASIASELNAIGAYLVEIITGGKIDQMVISTKTGSAVILTATGKINITTN